MKRHCGVVLLGFSLQGLAQEAACTHHPTPQFEDVTTAAGITFRHAFDLTKDYIFNSMPGGVLLLDYDRDGWLDIYFTNAPTYASMQRGERARSSLYRNNHDGTFSDVTEKAGVAFPCAAMGGAVGDYNNDGFPDMLITCLKGNVLYRNNGNGTFSDVTTQAGLHSSQWNTGAAFADYDGDGALDLAVAAYVDLDLNHLPQPGSSATCTYRGQAVQCGPHGLKHGVDTLFHNNGDGTFADASASLALTDRNQYFGLGMLWGDFDGSGLPSLFVANDSTPNYLFHNLTHGHFEEVALDAGVAMNLDGKEQANMGVAVGDYLHNGRPSLAVTTFSDEEKPLYRNDGHLQFTEDATHARLGQSAFPLLGWGISFADFDNDGWLDLMTVYGHVYPQVDKLAGSASYAEPKTLFMNEGGGTFCNASPLAGAALMKQTPARGLAVGDLFNNGQLDAVIENVDGSPMVLRNEGVAGHHWLELDLKGTSSNRSAIGAELTLLAAKMTQTAEVRSGGSYLSQSDLRVHFGLGSAVDPETLQIRWPSGKVEMFHNLRGDHIYTVTEGSGAAKLTP